MSEGGLFLILAAHLVLTALPGIAAILLATRFGLRSLPVLLAVGLAATGLVAILGFWIYYAGHRPGQAFSFLVLLGSVLVVGLAAHGRWLDASLLRRLATPWALWALGSVFVVYLGFAHGGIDAPIQTSATRFSAGPLPSDSGIPFFYAEWFYANGHHGTPPVFPGEWLASDRPPLQIGYVLSQRPFYWGEGVHYLELHYQVLGVVLQQLWIVGLWALLVAARLPRLTRALAMVAVLVSGLVFVNAFFVWPKLLPAAMLLAAAALVLTPLWDGVRRSLAGAILIAVLLGTAMLGHGSSVFAAIPLAIVALYRGLPSWRWVGVAALVGVALMAPWSAFQKYDDPPGNRLTKWMLAGADQIDGRGTGAAIVDGYREAGLGGTIDNKSENFEFMVGGEPAWELLDQAVTELADGNGDPAARDTRNLLFFFLLPELGLLLLAPLGMLIARRRSRDNPDEWRFALTAFAVVAIGALAWGLILFGNVPSRTVVHAGTYLLPILAFAGAVVGLRAVLPRVALGLVGLNCLLALVVYVPALEPPPGSAYSIAAFLLAAISLAGFGWLGWRGEPR
jgi:hypothetical protein